MVNHGRRDVESVPLVHESCHFPANPRYSTAKLQDAGGPVSWKSGPLEELNCAGTIGIATAASHGVLFFGQVIDGGNSCAPDSFRGLTPPFSVGLGRYFGSVGGKGVDEVPCGSFPRLHGDICLGVTEWAKKKP
jgi:hypothetical protein